MKKSELSFLRVKIKHLAAESQIIRAEKNKYKKSDLPNRIDTMNSLHWHRVDTVRPVARNSQLAYACLRGVPYSVVEPTVKANNPPDWNAIAKEAKRFKGYWRPAEPIDDWIAAAKAWFQSRENAVKAA